MMPMSYSEDLWQNILLEVGAQDVARYIHMSERTVYGYAEWLWMTGDVQQSAKRNGPMHLLSEHEGLLLVDASTMCRTAHRLGMPCQQIKHISLKLKEQNFRQRRRSLTHLWIDETGFDCRNAQYGYRIRG